MFRPFFLAVLLLPLAAPSSRAQSVRSSDVVSWQVRAERTVPGGEARVVLDAKIAPGWRLYAADSPVGRPVAVELVPPSGVEVMTLRQGPPQRAYDPGFESEYTYFEERARFVQLLRVAAGVRRGEREVTGTVRYAVCDDSVCLAPARLTFRVPLVVE